MPLCRVLVVDERRILAAGLARLLEDRPTIAEARVLQELSLLPTALNGGWHVVVTSEGYAGHVLRLVPPGTRVVVGMHTADAVGVAGLLRSGASAVCTSSDMPEDVVAAVEQAFRGEMRLPRHLVQDVLNELERLRRRAEDADDVLSQLTDRERDVLFRLGRGHGRTEIARDLGLSPHTVRTHVQHLLRKLALHSQLAAAAFARDLVVALGPHVDRGVDDAVVIDLEAHKQREAAGRQV